METLGYTEHRDAFDYDNIPENILDKAYHLELGSTDISNANQTIHEFNVPVVVRAFFKGYTSDDSSQTVDDVMVEVESIYNEVLKLSNRITPEIKNIVPGGFIINPRSATNQNDILLEMEFTAQTMCVFN